MTDYIDSWYPLKPDAPEGFSHYEKFDIEEVVKEIKAIRSRQRSAQVHDPFCVLVLFRDTDSRSLSDLFEQQVRGTQDPAPDCDCWLVTEWETIE